MPSPTPLIARRPSSTLRPSGATRRSRSCPEELFRRGFALYRERQDKSWGLTDCLSFVVMRERDIREALSADEDFEQAGFRALLRE